MIRVNTLVAVLAVLVGGLAFAGSATADDFRSTNPSGVFYLDSGCCSGAALKGTRDYINVGGGGSATAHCLVFSSYGHSSSAMLQTGMFWCASGSSNGPCVNHTNWWSFIERQDSIGYHCTQGSALSSGTNHLFTVDTTSGTTWTAYIDGSSTGISQDFGSSSASKIAERSEYTGGNGASYFVSITFPGPWQRWDGSSWVNVQSSSTLAQDGWVLSGGPPNSFSFGH